MEPAGSKGVWGLDDYHHLPFIFGVAQLIDNPHHLRPSDVLNADRVSRNASQYMYFKCIEWIQNEKKGPFEEHSNILYNAANAQNWEKVRGGLLRMYHEEVLDKWPIMQHMLFGSVMQWLPDSDERVQQLPTNAAPQRNANPTATAAPWLQTNTTIGTQAPWLRTRVTNASVPSALGSPAQNTERQSVPLVTTPPVSQTDCIEQQ